MELGRFGIWTAYRAIGEENAGEAARVIEQLGFGAVWLGGSPQVPVLRPLLAATRADRRRDRDPQRVAERSRPGGRDFAALDEEFPGRVLLGIGIGHPEAQGEYTKPLAAMRAFLDALDAAPAPVPRDRRCLAALAPNMLALCAERSLGSHTYFVNVEHTRSARAALGPGALLAPELACVLDGDETEGRATARKYAKLYLGLSNYTNALLRSGCTADDIADGGSDRLIDAVVPHGDARAIAAAASEHLAAGANHVCLQTVGVSGVPRNEWTALAGALGIA